MAKKSAKSSRSRTRNSAKPSRSGTAQPSSESALPKNSPPSDSFSHGLDGPSRKGAYTGKTGRLIATLPAADLSGMAEAVASLRKTCSLAHVCNSGDYPDRMDQEEAESADAIVFQEFGVAVLKTDPERHDMIVESVRAQGMIVEDEYWNHALGMVSTAFDDREPEQEIAGREINSLGYLRGFRDGLSKAIDDIERGPGADLGLIAAADFADSQTATWGLQATGVVSSELSGEGARVAVLDSGYDIRHPDFDASRFTSETFIPSSFRDGSGNLIMLPDTSATVDRSGHGTHCIGTACGPLEPNRRPNGQTVPRYGIAHGAQIFNGKVLSVIPGDPKAAGADAWILDGIRWAIRNGCSIISLSFGSQGRPSPMYEEIAKRALEHGVLILAAAGNESSRSVGLVNPVARPANCPSILAVAAVSPDTTPDGRFKLADFSNRHLVDQGGEINLSGPGVSVFSSYRSPTQYQFLDGTSQATPHAAGIAALVQQETGKTGRDLYLELRSRAIPQRTPPDVDYGNGLVHV